jgi:acyl carrier protein
MTKELLQEEIKLIVIESGRNIVNAQDIGYTDHLLEYGFNSISIVNLIDLLETHYGIQFNVKQDLKYLQSIESIYELLLTKECLK